jgi:hypothetical protein
MSIKTDVGWNNRSTAAATAATTVKVVSPIFFVVLF